MKTIVLNAGAGDTDVAVFSGNSSAYAVTNGASANEFNVVGPDGSDIVRNVELLRFADGDFTPASLVGSGGGTTPPPGGSTPPGSGGSSGASTGGGGGGSSVQVLEVRPAFGPTTGGTKALILGYGFWGASGVTVGGQPVQSFKYIDAATLEIVTPPGTAGWQDVIVTMPVGNTKAGFLYQEPAAAGSGETVSVPSAATATVAAATLVAKKPGTKLAKATTVKASAGQTITVKVNRGLPKKKLVTVRVKMDGKWVLLGKVRTTKKGGATLPPFFAAKAGNYPIKITSKGAKARYIKVVAS